MRFALQMTGTNERYMYLWLQYGIKPELEGQTWPICCLCLMIFTFKKDHENRESPGCTATIAIVVSMCTFDGTKNGPEMVRKWLRGWLKELILDPRTTNDLLGLARWDLPTDPLTSSSPKPSASIYCI